MFERTTILSCHFIVSLFVCQKLKFPFCLSLSVFLSVSLSFHAVAREAGRMRSLAAAEGHGEKTGIRRKNLSFFEHIFNRRGLNLPKHLFQNSNSGINVYNMRYFGAFSPLPYMAGLRYIVPVFNRLAAAALLRGFNLTLVMLNYFWSTKSIVFSLSVCFLCIISSAYTNVPVHFECNYL